MARGRAVDEQHVLVRSLDEPSLRGDEDYVWLHHAGCRTGFGSESGQHAITVTEAEAQAKLLAMTWGLSNAGRGRSARSTVADGLSTWT
ncbi:hypothetical protein [Singulisphaera sp. GP187]|uniref:hypothetical protein n=1 Tax=Singulisphaera sp. GP187 TaxID=1882752 RepID=UPI0009417F43|nr:hypothetical protein [Singulisphaera sp. GP187]